MSLELLSHLSGLILLCIPAAFLGRRRHILTSLDSVIDKPSRRLGPLHLLQAFDLFRAAVGLYLLQLSWQVATGTTDHLVITALLGLTALAGLSFQVFFWGDAEAISAPIAYLTGLLIGLAPLIWLVPAIVLGIATAIAWRHLWAFFGATAVGISVAGVGLKVMSVPLTAVLIGLCLAGPAFAFITTRKLQLVTRRPVIAADPSNVLREIAIPALDRSRAR